MNNLANQTEKKSTILNNLRSIYKVQTSGTLQVFLRELRASKSQLEEELRIIQDNKKSRVNNVPDTSTKQSNKDKPASVIKEQQPKPKVEEQEKPIQNKREHLIELKMGIIKNAILIIIEILEIITAQIVICKGNIIAIMGNSANLDIEIRTLMVKDNSIKMGKALLAIMVNNALLVKMDKDYLEEITILCHQSKMPLRFLNQLKAVQFFLNLKEIMETKINPTVKLKKRNKSIKNPYLERIS